MNLESCGAIVTGASRGIGVSLAEALAAKGVRMVLVARSKEALEEVRDRLSSKGAKVSAFAADVADLAALEQVVAHARAELGAIDLLVNNAGVELTSHYQHLRLADVERTIRVNLLAPMALTHMLLPGMLAQDRGHVLNVASLAGLCPTAFAEPYCATKHGLVGFTRSMRVSLQAQRSRVSASVVCPGFVSEAGMFADMSRDCGIKAPEMLGTCSPGDVAAACVRAIERDEPEVIVNAKPVRPALVLAAMMPRFAEWLSRVTRASETFKTVAEHRLGASGSGASSRG